MVYRILEAGISEVDGEMYGRVGVIPPLEKGELALDDIPFPEQSSSQGSTDVLDLTGHDPHSEIAFNVTDIIPEAGSHPSQKAEPLRAKAIVGVIEGMATIFLERGEQVTLRSGGGVLIMQPEEHFFPKLKTDHDKSALVNSPLFKAILETTRTIRYRNK